MDAGSVFVGFVGGFVTATVIIGVAATAAVDLLNQQHHDE